MWIHIFIFIYIYFNNKNKFIIKEIYIYVYIYIFKYLCICRTLPPLFWPCFWCGRKKMLESSKGPVGFLSWGCSRGGGNWGTLRILRLRESPPSGISWVWPTLMTVTTRTSFQHFSGSGIPNHFASFPTIASWEGAMPKVFLFKTTRSILVQKAPLMVFGKFPQSCQWCRCFPAQKKSQHPPPVLLIKMTINLSGLPKILSPADKHCNMLSCWKTDGRLRHDGISPLPLPTSAFNCSVWKGWVQQSNPEKSPTYRKMGHGVFGDEFSSR